MSKRPRRPATPELPTEPELELELAPEPAPSAPLPGPEAAPLPPAQRLRMRAAELEVEVADLVIHEAAAIKRHADLQAAADTAVASAKAAIGESRGYRGRIVQGRARAADLRAKANRMEG